MTLLETLVALAIIAIGVVGIGRGFITITQDGAIAQQQVMLQGIATDAVHQIREQPYTPCATPSDYQRGLPPPVVVTSVSASAERSLSRSPSDNSQAMAVSCPGTRTDDYGEEEITIRVCAASTCIPDVTFWKADG